MLIINIENSIYVIVDEPNQQTNKSFFQCKKRSESEQFEKIIHTLGTSNRI